MSFLYGRRPRAAGNGRRAALPPVLAARRALLPVAAEGGGSSTYSGKGVLSQYDSNFQSQSTLMTLANDTGGKAFLDSNDFAPAFTKVHDDTSFYYLLGYVSNNTQKAGRYREDHGPGQPAGPEKRQTGFPAKAITLPRSSSIPIKRRKNSNSRISWLSDAVQATFRSICRPDISA